jgi:hypothetical protein
LSNLKLEIATETAAEDMFAGTTTTTTTGPDPFDLDSLRLDPAFEETAGVAKVLSTVPVRKPNDQEWFRVHPSLAYRGNFSCVKLKAENEFYLLKPKMARDFQREMTIIQVTLYTVMNTSGVVSLWPCRIASADGRQNAWHSSAQEAAAKAMEQRVGI